MGRLDIIDKIGEDPKVCALFLLNTLFLQTLNVREMLARIPIDCEAIRMANQINHRLLPIIQKLLNLPDKETWVRFGEVIQMLENVGMNDLMLQSLEKTLANSK